MTGRRLIQPGSPISSSRSTLDLSYLAEAFCPGRDLVSVVPRHSRGARELSTVDCPRSFLVSFSLLLAAPPGHPNSGFICRLGF
ncbi:hypothetical protein BDW67DRAFT_155529 [Aspergillus spinulosporus]